MHQRRLQISRPLSSLEPRNQLQQQLLQASQRLPPCKDNNLLNYHNRKRNLNPCLVDYFPRSHHPRARHLLVLPTRARVAQQCPRFPIACHCLEAR